MQEENEVAQSIRSGLISPWWSWHVCMNVLLDEEGAWLRHLTKKQVCRFIFTKKAVTGGRSSSRRVDEGRRKVRMTKINYV